MAYKITKLPDGDVSLGNLRAEQITLKPAADDYATGGYLVEGIGGATEDSGNVGLDKVLGVIPYGGQGGYVPVWNPATSKLQVFQSAGTLDPLTEVPAATDLSAYTFYLLAFGL